MAVQTIYILASAGITPNFFGPTQLNGTAPTGANSAYGWGPGQISVATPYYRGRLGATAVGGDAGLSASYNAASSGPTKGTGTGATTAGDSFVAGPFTGTFAATPWTFNWNLRASTAGAIGHVNMRMWKSANADGSSATQLLANTAGATVTLSTSADVNSSITWSQGALTLTNEYLFFQVEWQETTAGSSINNDILFRAGTCSITTADFNTTWGDHGSYITLSNGNLDATNISTGNNRATVRANTPHSTGRWYCEVEILAGISYQYTAFGAIDDSIQSSALNTDGGSPVNAGGTRGDGGNFYNGFAPQAGTAIPSVSVGDRIQIAVDCVSQGLYLGSNNTWTTGSNPSTLTNPRFTWTTLPGINVYPWVDTIQGNVVRIHPDAATQIYAPPTGFQPWSAADNTGSHKLVRSFTLSNERNNFTGWVGVYFVAGTDRTYNKVGLYCGAGTTGIHNVRLYNAATTSPATLLQSWTLDLTGAAPGTFAYGVIPQVTLTAGATYLIAAQVTSGDGQFWAENSATALRGTNNVNAVYSSDGSNFTVGGGNTQYGGVDLDVTYSGPPIGILSSNQVNQTLSATGTVPIAVRTARLGGSPTIFLCHADSFADDSFYQHALLAGPNVQIATSSPAPKFGTGSFLLNADYITSDRVADYWFDAGPFTVEAWCYFTGLANYNNSIAGNWASSPGQRGWLWTVDNAQGNIIHFSTTGSDSFGYGNTTAQLSYINYNTWQHFVCERDAVGTVRMYVDGVVVYNSGAGLNWALYHSPVAFTLASFGFPGYLDEIRVSKIARYASNTGFTPPAAPFTVDYPNYTQPNQTFVATGVSMAPATATLGQPIQTKLLIHADGLAGSTTFTDDAGHILTASNVTVRTAQSRFGGSADFTASGSAYIDTGNATDFQFGAGQFTVEAWAYFTSTPVSAFSAIAALGRGSGAGSNNAWIFGINSNGPILLYTSSGSSYFALGVFGYTPPANTWVHLAVDRDVGGTVNIYANGVPLISSTITDTFFPSTLTATIGNDYPAAFGFPGYLDEIRVTKGFARFRGPFTPSTSSYTIEYSGQQANQTVRANNFTPTTTPTVMLSASRAVARSVVSSPGVSARTVVLSDVGVSQVVVTGPPTGSLVLTQANQIGQTNYVTNPRAEGAVAGTPGTAPTGWTIPATAGGISTQIVGIGTENGIPYLDLRMFGTTVASNPDLTIYLAPVNTIPGRLDDTWVNSFYVRMVGGTPLWVTQFAPEAYAYQGTTQLATGPFAQYFSASANLNAVQLDASARFATPPTPISLASYSGAFAPTDNIRPAISFEFSAVAGRAVDLTVRIGGPQLERNVFTPLRLPPVGTPAQTTWVVTGIVVVTGSLILTQADQTLAGPGRSATLGLVPIPSPSCVLLVHADGTTGSTTFTDSSPSAHTLTATLATITTAVQKFGPSSADLNANFASRIDVAGSVTDFNFGAGQFTVEAWCYIPSSSGTLQAVASQWGSGTSNLSWLFCLSSGNLNFYYSPDGTAANTRIFGSYTPPTNTWFHLAADRDTSNVLRIYANGAVINSATVPDTFYPSTTTGMVGNDHNNNHHFCGQLDEIRVIKGRAMYGGAFAPPTQPFSASNTVLLVHGDGTNGSTVFTDSSLSANTLTATSATVNATSKFGSGSANFSTTISSRIDTGNATDFNFGVGPFTVEAWVYVTGVVTSPTIAGQMNWSGGNQGWAFWADPSHLYFEYSPDGTTRSELSAAYVLPSSTWVHLAIDRDASGNVRFYANGSVLNTVSMPSAIYPSTLNCIIGNDNSATDRFPGYLDEIRVTKGVARFAGAFTPPTAPYPPDFATGIIQADQTLVANGTVGGTAPITGALNLTQANQTLSATGTVQVRGTLGVTQANQTLAAAGKVAVSGTLAVTQAAQTLVAAGALAISGTLAATQAAQTLVAAGTVALSGTLASTQANQTLVAAGKVSVSGTLAVTQTSQTLVAAGTVALSGTLVTTQANQTLVAAGAVAINGILASTQVTQTLAATGVVAASGSAALTGVAISSGAGALSARADGLVILSGVATGAAPGTVTARSDARVNLPSAAFTAISGGLTVMADAGLALTGAGGTLAAGNLATAIGSNVFVNLPGAAITASANAVTSSADNLVSLSGAEIVGSTGTVIAMIPRVTTLTGVDLRGGAGTITVPGANYVPIDIHGAGIVASPGSFAAIVDARVPLSGAAIRVETVAPLPYIAFAMGGAGISTAATSPGIRLTSTGFTMADLEIVVEYPPSSDTEVSLTWSDDSGATFVHPIERSLGLTGEYLVSATWRRLGMGRTRIFAIEWSAPTLTALTGAFVETSTSQS